MKRALKKLIQLFLGLFIVFHIYFMIRLYWLTSCAIPSYSMAPTLLGGDYIFTSMQIPGRRIFEEDPLYPGRYQVHRKKGIREVILTVISRSFTSFLHEARSERVPINK